MDSLQGQIKMVFMALLLAKNGRLCIKESFFQIWIIWIKSGSSVIPDVPSRKLILECHTSSPRSQVKEALRVLFPAATSVEFCESDRPYQRWGDEAIS